MGQGRTKGWCFPDHSVAVYKTSNTHTLISKGTQGALSGCASLFYGLILQLWNWNTVLVCEALEVCYFFWSFFFLCTKKTEKENSAEETPLSSTRSCETGLVFRRLWKAQTGRVVVNSSILKTVPACDLEEILWPLWASVLSRSDPALAQGSSNAHLVCTEPRLNRTEKAAALMKPLF